MSQEIKPDMQDPDKRTIGPFEILKSLGKGGMGEVFLVYDSLCDRKIALKQISPKLVHQDVIKERFLREAKVASKLSHPCIIPIYSIHQDEDRIYYTMPYVEGETLKEIFTSSLEKELKGLAPHKIGSSIQALTRIFYSVCQAVSYAYSKGVLHRDLKPENIIVGKYGEVFVLDWGIAKYIASEEDDETGVDVEVGADLTRPGKVLGTVNYMAPERALKAPASLATEIYSLGVILYQILTLQLPFQRRNLEHFRKIIKFETFTLPEELTPYRDIPKQLSQITQKCLSFKPEERYENMEELLFDLENYIEGKPDWLLASELKIATKTDWELQENILLSKHLAITRIIDVIQWYAYMLSKKAYSGNIRLEFSIKFPSFAEGLGILMCVPPSHERKDLEDGYCLWIGSPNNPYAALFRSNAEVMSVPESGITSDGPNHICIEKIDNNVRLYVDGALKLNYVSHLPILGSHVGLLFKDSNFEMSPLKIYTGSQHVMVNCLSVPDAFLGSKNFSKAYEEYKRIAQSFSGRTEGREAQFRAGITLIEEGKTQKNKEKAEDLYYSALEEFEKLRSTPAAPLEYLGKSLVYYAQNEIEEEIKCLELAIRKYPKHPFLNILKEQIIFRLHETSKTNRTSAYHFALLALRHMPEVFQSVDHNKLLQHLYKHLQPLPFIHYLGSFSEKKHEFLHIALQLAFWTYKPLALLEIIDTLSNDTLEKVELILNALYALYFMGFEEDALKKVEEQKHQVCNIDNKESCYRFRLLEEALVDVCLLKESISFFTLVQKPFTYHEIRFLYAFIEKHYEKLDLKPIILELKQTSFADKRTQKFLKALLIKLYLLSGEIEKAHEELQKLPEKEFTNPRSLFYFFYGIYLAKKENVEKALQHFKKVPLDSFSNSHMLASHAIVEKLPKDVESKALYFEKVQMYKDMILYYTVIEKKSTVESLKKKLKNLSTDYKKMHGLDS